MASSLAAPSPWPLVIAHRGASGYLPEHTLEAYRLGAEMGADFIEPDLVFTKDGHLVARHDRALAATTDVADRPAFANRRTTKPGHDEGDWFAEDFTLAELKTLKARQAFPGRSPAADNRFTIPTFDEVLNLAKSLTQSLGRPIGVYPETKSPGAFARLGFDFLPPLLACLAAQGWGDAGAPIIIQSFEEDILKRLRQHSAVRLMLLLDEHADVTPGRLKAIAGFASGIGPWKGLLFDARSRSSGLVEAAHEAGLFVHPWTLRDDQLPPGVESPRDEYARLYDMGVDGVFSDFPDTAHSVRLARRARRR